MDELIRTTSSGLIKKPGKSAAFALLIFAIGIAAYAPVAGNGFVSYDDDIYVTDNDIVKRGITKEGFRWAFLNYHANNWHPATWFSHMGDVSLFGMNPAGHHSVSLAIHLTNALLLFFLLVSITTSVYPSALTAALFAVHPIHVESVAWVAERKDVLSMLFALLALHAYGKYASRRKVSSYFVTIFFFLLSLMSKPMMVTLPLLFLVLDYWPLGRFQRKIPGSDRPAQKTGLFLVAEKIPFIAMSLAVSAITVLAQSEGGAVVARTTLPIAYRLSNAALSYVKYLYLAVYPKGLAVFYPHPEGGIPLWQSAFAVVLLILLTTLFAGKARPYPWFIAGWAWYVIALIPVIGVVQVGSQAMADRYAYLPFIGLYAGLAWGLETFASTSRRNRAILNCAAAAVILLFAHATNGQVRYWKTSETLFLRALSVTSGNAAMEYHLAMEYRRKGDSERAREHFTESLRINSNLYWVFYELALIDLEGGNFSRARSYLEKFLAFDGSFAPALQKLGISLQMEGKLDEAEETFKRVLSVNEPYPEAHNNLGALYLNQRKVTQALAHLKRAVALSPDYADAHFNLGLAYKSAGNNMKARLHFREALAINPAYAPAALELNKSKGGTQRE